LALARNTAPQKLLWNIVCEYMDQNKDVLLAEIVIVPGFKERVDQAALEFPGSYGLLKEVIEKKIAALEEENKKQAEQHKADFLQAMKDDPIDYDNELPEK